MSFHFTTERPDEQIFTDIQKINAFNEEILREFVIILLKVLQGEVDLTQEIANFSQTHGINEARLKPIVKTLIYFFRSSIKNNASPKHVGEDLLAFGINKEQAVVVAQCWKENFLAFSKSIIGQTLTVNEVLDMEWRFGVTAATDEVANCGSSYLQLRLVLDKGNGRTQTTDMELTLPQFYDFVQQMEKAKSHLEFFG